MQRTMRTDGPASGSSKAVGASKWAGLMRRRSDIITEEAMTAATAIVQRLTAVTRNVGDSGQLGVELHHRCEGEAQ